MNPWKVKIISIIPEMFPGPLNYSLIGRAFKEKKWTLESINLKDFAEDKHHTIDDVPYGGGPGMVIRPDIIEKALKKTLENMETKLPLVYMTPVGKPLVQDTLKRFSSGPGIVILCGRFEGVDERILDEYDFEKISLGDFVLSGGETAAIALIEGCVRLLPSVIGSKESLKDESFNSNLLEYPQYTKPQIWLDENKRKHEVPEVLLSGHHQKIKEWRKKKSLEITKKMRPDLLNDKD